MDLAVAQDLMQRWLPEYLHGEAEAAESAPAVNFPAGKACTEVAAAGEVA